MLNREDAGDAADDANIDGFSVVSAVVVEDGGVATVSVWVVVGDTDPKRGCGFIAEREEENLLVYFYMVGLLFIRIISKTRSKVLTSWRRCIR